MANGSEIKHNENRRVEPRSAIRIIFSRIGAHFAHPAPIKHPGIAWFWERRKTRRLEAGLSAMAAAQGLAVPAYMQHLIAEHISVRTEADLSQADRIAAWEIIKDLLLTPLLSDTAISRESFYGPRG